ncbi:MAG: response regulator [Leptospiraceae bacterium]|nr:response regulator [Leptospiraceae bacterium]
MAASHSSSRSINSPLRILVVEDEGISALVAQKTLEKMGYQVLGPVNNGAQAIEMALQELPDSILMDINLFGPINGIMAAERIKAVRDIPIVFVTAYSDKAIRRRAELTHPLAYFEKPVQYPRIDALLQSTVKTKLELSVEQDPDADL